MLAIIAEKHTRHSIVKFQTATGRRIVGYKGRRCFNLGQTQADSKTSPYFFHQTQALSYFTQPSCSILLGELFISFIPPQIYRVSTICPMPYATTRSGIA
jgi:hypothetical protein